MDGVARLGKRLLDTHRERKQCSYHKQLTFSLSAFQKVYKPHLQIGFYEVLKLQTGVGQLPFGCLLSMALLEREGELSGMAMLITSEASHEPKRPRLFSGDVGRRQVSGSVLWGAEEILVPQHIHFQWPLVLQSRSSFVHPVLIEYLPDAAGRLQPKSE